jgi:hypothetical protein
LTFHSSSTPLFNSRRSVVMHETDVHGKVTQRDRPAARILIKDAPEPSFQAVRTLDNEQFAVAWGGPYISSANAVEIRTLDTLIEAWAGLGAPLSVCGRRLLASGPLAGGQNASTRIFDLDDRRVIVELPVAPPCVMSPSSKIFARIRLHYDFESEPIVDPALAARFPELRKIIDADGGALVCCDLDGKVVFTITERQLAEPYAELTGLALARDESTLYYSGHRSVGAVDVLSGRLRWVRHFGEDCGERYVCLREIAISLDETRMAVAGASGSKEPSIRVLSTHDGHQVDSLPSAGRWDALVFHGATLIAGGNRGRVLLLDDHRQRREIKVASAGVNDLAVLGGGLLCACDQRQLRYLPLLDDE